MSDNCVDVVVLLDDACRASAGTPSWAGRDLGRLLDELQDDLIVLRDLLQRGDYTVLNRFFSKYMFRATAPWVPLDPVQLEPAAVGTINGPTVRVEVHVAVGENGDWTAYGYKGATRDDALSVCLDGVDDDLVQMSQLWAFVPCPIAPRIEATPKPPEKP